MEEGIRPRVHFYLRRVTGPLRMLPRFLIIGAQKSGTTTLYKYLNQHPAVAGSFTQEVHFFDLNFHKGLNWYRAHFPTLLYKRAVDLARKVDLITGEASAYYLLHPHVCRRVREVLPDVRLIALLRDPVERAWAHYRQAIGRFEHLSFEEAIAEEEVRLSGERLRLLRDEGAVSFAYREYSYLTRGIYVDQLRTWMETFPRKQILILKSEDLLFDDPASVVGRTQEFLDLPRRDPTRWYRYRREDQPPIDPAIRGRLKEYFRPHNRRLFAYLGTDLDWEG